MASRGGSPWLGCGHGWDSDFQCPVGIGQSHLPRGSSGSSLPPRGERAQRGFGAAPVLSVSGGQGHKVGCGGRTGKGPHSQGRSECLSTSGDPSKTPRVFPGGRFLEDVLGEAEWPGCERAGCERFCSWPWTCQARCVLCVYVCVCVRSMHICMGAHTCVYMYVCEGMCVHVYMRT